MTQQTQTDKNWLAADVEAIQGGNHRDKAWELGRVCRRAGCTSPETSSPYKFRGVALDAECHKHFVAGWCDEDMAQMSEPVAQGVSKASSDAAWWAARVIAKTFGNDTHLSDVASTVEAAIAKARGE